MRPGAAGSLAQGSLPYDMLIVAGCPHYSYLCQDDWRGYAPEVKSLDRPLATGAQS